MKKVTVKSLLSESEFTVEQFCAKLGIDEMKWYYDFNDNWFRMTVSQFALFAEMLEVRPEDLYKIWDKERKQQEKEQGALDELFGGINPVQELEDFINDLKTDNNE
jgi:hypothetical protein